MYIPVADGTTATVVWVVLSKLQQHSGHLFVTQASPSQDEHGLTFEEFPPTETPSDFWTPFLVISSEINGPSLTGSLLGGINLTVTAVTGEPWSCRRKNIFCKIFCLVQWTLDLRKISTCKFKIHIWLYIRHFFRTTGFYIQYINHS